MEAFEGEFEEVEKHMLAPNSVSGRLWHCVSDAFMYESETQCQKHPDLEISLVRNVENALFCQKFSNKMTNKAITVETLLNYFPDSLLEKLSQEHKADYQARPEFQFSLVRNTDFSVGTSHSGTPM